MRSVSASVLNRIRPFILINGSVSMKNLRLVAVGLALMALPLLAAPCPVAGQVIYGTGFEDPPFARGSQLVGQDGWIAPPILSPNAAVIVTEMSIEGRQTVRVRGRDLEHQDFINEVTDGYYDAIGSYRHPVFYDTRGTQVVRVSADLRVSGPGTADGDNFFSASLGAPNSLGEGLGEIAISSDGQVYAYTGNDLVPTFLFSAPITLNEWHNLALELDFLNGTTSFFVDGEFLGMFSWDDEGIVYSPILGRGSLLVYAAPDTATRKKQNYTAHYDRFLIEVVGE